MRVTPLLMALLLSGCLAATAPPQPVGETQPALQDPFIADKFAPISGELAGANVTWNGMGTVTMELKVPANTSALWLAWWSDSKTVQGGGYQIAATVEMEGCPTDPQLGGSGAAVGGRWCENPPVGLSQLTWTLNAGFIEGRVCVMLTPSNQTSPSDCRFSPF